MIFVINNLKYNTDNMTLISDKCKYTYKGNLLSCYYYAKNVKLWKSNKNNWLLTYERDFTMTCAISLTEEEAKKKLIMYDLETYEKMYGELEEA